MLFLPRLENNFDNQNFESTQSNEKELSDIPSGVSMENASYMENNINDVQESIDNIATSSDDIIEEYTPKLFLEEQSYQENAETESNESANDESEQLFDQDTNEEEDFEIPAFLRKQKF